MQVPTIIILLLATSSSMLRLFSKLLLFLSCGYFPKAAAAAAGTSRNFVASNLTLGNQNQNHQHLRISEYTQDGWTDKSRALVLQEIVEYDGSTLGDWLGMGGLERKKYFKPVWRVIQAILLQIPLWHAKIALKVIKKVSMTAYGNPFEMWKESALVFAIMLWLWGTAFLTLLSIIPPLDFFLKKPVGLLNFLAFIYSLFIVAPTFAVLKIAAFS